MLNTRADAYRLLEQLGASKRLLLHLRLVGEAADLLMQGYTKLGISCDGTLVELGVAVHDAGKIEHPAELDGPGSLHEPAGLALLLARGVQPEVAKCCVSHAAWHVAGVSFEELSVALADKLWKGKREADLELLVIDAAAIKLGVTRWDVYPQLDLLFERITSSASERLRRSRQV
jgi:hypothetical protein